MSTFTISGQLVDLNAERIYPAVLTVAAGKIAEIVELPGPGPDFPTHYILPGFIDSHVHIESSMLVPAEFAKLAVVHGTVATVSDPHEIANVCGMAGVEFMIENGRTVPFKFNFGAPSCVPATKFETAGATLDSKAVEQLLERPDIKYLSEMMNFPGVLAKDEEVMKKIQAAHRLNKPVDGHAPGLRGDDVRTYIQGGRPQSSAESSRDSIGISTDHECFTREEALEKLACGMKILIREGSAAKNFEALISLLKDYPNQIMFCSDDKHPDSLVEGHINLLCARAIAKGHNIFHVLKAACANPVLHYQLESGLLKPGDPADFIVVRDLQHFEVLNTYIDGVLVASQGQSLIDPMAGRQPEKTINNFYCHRTKTADFAVHAKERGMAREKVPVIRALDGQLITGKLSATVPVSKGMLMPSIEEDILKIVVVNRYYPSPPAIAFIKNFGLKQGALASSVAHDSHNIVAVGVDDESLSQAINLVVAHQGGISIVKENLDMVIPLPVAGLMSFEDGRKIARQYSLIDQAAKEAGTKLTSPFMTLSFMALLVIPHLKLSDLGLFDGDQFALLP